MDSAHGGDIEFKAENDSYINAVDNGVTETEKYDVTINSAVITTTVDGNNITETPTEMAISISKKRGNRGSHGRYSTEMILCAVESVVKDKTSVNKAARLYGVPRTTLGRFVEMKRNNPDQELQIGHQPNRKIFTSAQEGDLKEYLKFRAKMCCGLSRKDLRVAAFQFALANSVDLPPCWIRDNAAGIEWLRQYRRRHSDVILKKPKNYTSATFNRQNVTSFYENLKTVYESVSSLDKIYHLAETQLFSLQSLASQKVLMYSSSQYLKEATNENQSHTRMTACCIVSASGSYLPPVILLPSPKGKLKTPRHKDGPPAGTLFLGSKSGMLTGELFVDVMKHFISYSKSSLQNPTLLIYDNQEVHLHPTAVMLGKKNGVNIVTLPPQSNQKMNPLEISIFQTLRSLYHQSAEQWISNNHGKLMEINHMWQIFGPVFEQSFTVPNIQAGFYSAGIVPYNPDIFTDDDFSSSNDEPDTVVETDHPSPSPGVNDIMLIQPDILMNDDCDIGHLIDSNLISSYGDNSSANQEPTSTTKNSINLDCFAGMPK